MNKEYYMQEYYIQGSDHFLIPKDVFMELFDELEELKDKINGAVFDLDNLEQEIFGLDEYTNWIYNELDAIRMRLKGEEDENNK